MHQMAIPRRYLPSISLLSAFEAVARTGSVAEAARELDLTQGTVSRLVQSLEAQLDVMLFRRVRKRLIPTEAARVYGVEVAGALGRIGQATLAVTTAPDSGTLTLAILPTFGAHWLAPRLPAFLNAHPGITLNLATRLRPFDFLTEGFDAAIHFGRADWPGAGHVTIFEERIVAVAAPSLAEGFARPDSLLAAALLQIESRPNAWRVWFAAHGVAAAPPRGMAFDQFAPMMQAAIHGIGVALLPEFLARDAIADGRLAALGQGAVAGQGSYRLVWPEARGDFAPLVAFRAWIAGLA
jgi:LysR family transcriptional regulator, glycine cleavage system transcriptional activator